MSAEAVVLSVRMKGAMTEKYISNETMYGLERGIFISISWPGFGASYF